MVSRSRTTSIDLRRRIRYSFRKIIEHFGFRDKLAILFHSLPEIYESPVREASVIECEAVECMRCERIPKSGTFFGCSLSLSPTLLRSLKTSHINSAQPYPSANR